MSKPARKRPRPPASGEPSPEPALTPEPATKAPREPVNTSCYHGGCTIKDGAAVDANGNPIVGLVVVDGVVYRESGTD